MTKFGTIIAIILCIAGGLYYNYLSQLEASNLEKKKLELSIKMNTPGTVVYAVRDVAAGKRLSSSDVVEKEIPQSRIPSAALTKSSNGIGKLLGYGISKGQIVSGYDFDPPLPGLTVSVVMSSRFLEEGTTIKQSDLAKKYTVVQPEGTIKPAGAIRSFDAVVGKKLKSSIENGKILTTYDF